LNIKGNNMEIDTEEATKLMIFIFTILALVIVLNVFYPNDFGIFSTDLLLNPIRFDTATILGWTGIITVGGILGFFTSGSSLQIAIIGLLLGFCVLIYPIFVYIGNILTLGMFTYPSMDMHKEVPLIFLLLIAIPMSVGIFYLAFDLITSAIHSSTGGD